MSRQAGTLLAAGTAAAAGLTYYNLRGSNTARSESEAESTPRSFSAPSQAHAKKDLGLGGAGIGGNAVAGGTEGGDARSSPTRDEGRKVVTRAPKDKLPAGGVGGGVGAGGASARAMEVPVPRASGVSLTDSTGLDSIQGIFGQGGSKAGQERHEDTKSISKKGSEVPSKRNPPA
ncbi:hypothetical protein CDD81_1291 [Ophiocordyceps australis]|uniref:Uncharacterized protein n=1 Tax=Ophiocordyceps australis TaxID=1399860 RepID=A0A2C5XZD7_9HYPO|nr:hypothetical protein CDD81_1291 [Ophiocordyceps australis]